MSIDVVEVNLLSEAKKRPDSRVGKTGVTLLVVMFISTKLSADTMSRGNDIDNPYDRVIWELIPAFAGMTVMKEHIDR